MEHSESLYPKLKSFIDSLNTSQISEQRKQELLPLIESIQDNRTYNKPLELVFICTHNSRRSVLAQVWAQTLSFYFKQPYIHCYSGGTEATSVYPLIIEVLVESGLKIAVNGKYSNSNFSISYAANVPSIAVFSKRFDDAQNPSQGFLAIMTCSHADQNCPFVAGAIKRFTLTYEDPKIYDETTKEKENYNIRNYQIATEMKFIFSKINI